MEARETDPSSDSDDSYSSVDNLPSLTLLDNPPVTVRVSPDRATERRRSSFRGVGWLVHVASSLVRGSSEEHHERSGRESVNSSHSLTVRAGEVSADDHDSSSSASLLVQGDLDNEFHDAVNAPDQLSDSAASHDSQYMFDNHQNTAVVNAERRSSSSIDPDHGDLDKLSSTNSVFLPDSYSEEQHTRKTHGKRKVEKSRTQTELLKDSSRKEDDAFRHSYRTKRHDRSVRRDHSNKVHDEAEKIRRKHRRHESDKTSGTNEIEGKVRKDRERTGANDRSKTVRRKRMDSERTSDTTVSKKDKPSRDNTVRRGHHPSVNRPSDRTSSSHRKPVKDNTMSKHQRKYLTSEELASQSSASLLSVVKQEGTYNANEKPATRRACERKPKKKIPPVDHPYNNYDSISEKHLRREKKRLKHPKITSFFEMGRSTKSHTHRVDSHKSRPRSAPTFSRALVLKSESRRASTGVSIISCFGIIVLSFNSFYGKYSHPFHLSPALPAT